MWWIGPILSSMINKKSTTPLYIQIKQVIESRIEGGQYAVGEKIHSESELCAQFDVGRPTVRQAISALSHEGLLESQRGKGVFVMEKDSPLDLFSSMGTTGAFNKLNRSVQTKVLSIGTTQNLSMRFFENTDQTDDEFIELQRLRLIEGSPVIWEHTLIRKRLVPGLLEANLENTSLTKVLQERFNLFFTEARQNFSVTNLDADQKKLFGRNCPDAMLYLERELQINEQKGHYFSRLVVDTRRYPLYQEITNFSK